MDGGQFGVWSRIGDSFHATRPRPWDDVVGWLRTLPSGGRVLDLMGGNGRHARAAVGVGLATVVLDWSRPLLRHAPGARIQADATHLPLGDASFDAIACIAGLHGLASAQRTACWREMRRVARPGARLLATVWSRDATRFAGRPADLDVAWRAHGHDEARRVHLYGPGELRREAEAAGWRVAVEREAALGGGPRDNHWLEALAEP